MLNELEQLAGKIARVLRHADALAAENQRLRDELRAMKDRLAVLERLATDNNDSGARLDREIEKLRDRP